MTSFTTDVAIIGAGIQGSATARELALRGVDVMVLDAEYAGRHASGVNAGGVRTLNRHIAELPLALAAKRLWQRIGDLVDEDCGYRETGQMHIAIDEASLAKFRQRNEAILLAQIPHTERILSPAEVRQLVPHFDGPVAGASYVADDGHALPFHTTQAFRRKAQALGARFLEGCALKEAQKTDGGWRLRSQNGHDIRATKVINCTGAWAGEVSKLFGDSLNIVPNGSMQLVTTRLSPFLRPVVGVHGQSMAAKQFDNGTVVIGGGRRSPVNLETKKADLTLSGLVLAARQASRFFPILKTATIARAWSGIEGFTPDGLPIIDFGRDPSVLHAAGFSAHGFQLGPAVGGVLADLITTGQTQISIAPFSSSRFSVR